MCSPGTDGCWIEEEMACIDFGDIRLNKRFQTLASELANKPSQPINQASSDWAATKAAYRFFDNSKILPERILEPHFLSTQLRAEGHRRLVVVQDTSFIDFTKHVKTTDLGPIGGKQSDGFEAQGLALHCAMALSEKGLPLGLLSHKMWPRTRKKSKDSHFESLLPIEKKESFKWFEALRKTIESTPDHEVVMVCDREGDIFEFLEECLTRGVDFVIRVQHARMLDDEEFGDLNIFDRLAIAETKSHVTIEVPGSGKRPSRQAKLAVKFLPVTYAAHPRGIKTKQVSKRTSLELNVVHLFEENPPKGEAAIHWTLVTTLDVNNLGDALEVVRFYKMRWQIELYFKTLKTGCGVENCRLESAFLNRVVPESSCESFLTEDEWRTLWLKKYRRQIKSGQINPLPPKTPPTTREAIRWIAMRGGFLGRKGDGEPGQITIWRGWLDLMAAVELYEIIK